MDVRISLLLLYRTAWPATEVGVRVAVCNAGGAIMTRARFVTAVIALKICVRLRVVGSPVVRTSVNAFAEVRRSMHRAYDLNGRQERAKQHTQPSEGSKETICAGLPFHW